MATQTIRDFITECELYEYSQEYFSLMKECSELALMERYITNMTFISENKDYLESVTFSEGYFGETSTTMSIPFDLNAKKADTEKKKTGIFKRVLNALIRFWDKVVSIWRKFLRFFEGSAEQCRYILKNLRKNAIGKSTIGDIQEILTGTSNPEYNSGSKRQPFSNTLKLQYASDVDDNTKKSLEDNLSVAISTDTVIIQGNIMKKWKDAQLPVVTGDELVKLSNDTFSIFSYSTDGKKVQDEIHNLEKNSAKITDITVSVKNNMIDRTVEALTDSFDRFKDFAIMINKKIAETSGSTYTGPSPKNLSRAQNDLDVIFVKNGTLTTAGFSMSPGTLNALMVTFKSLTKIISGTISFYSSFINYRAECIGKLEYFIKHDETINNVDSN